MEVGSGEVSRGNEYGVCERHETSNIVMAGKERASIAVTNATNSHRIENSGYQPQPKTHKGRTSSE